MAIVNCTKTFHRLMGCVYLVLALGCQGEPTTVSGRVTLDGQPLAIREDMRGTVVFQPTSGDGRTLNGIIDAAGRYKLAEGSSSFVTPSVYWVTVSAVQLMPPSDDRPSSGKRVTPAKYASATDSGFRFEVVPGPNKIDLPLTSESEPESADPIAAQPSEADGSQPMDAAGTSSENQQ